jgi:putative ABC transport system permease protein
VNQIYESILIALQSIWSNKLRSFMTVLGNIVAVTSIVTVVSLIQGMNAYVTNAIVADVGADSFTIQQFGFVTSDEEFDKVRNNPRINTDEADAVRKSNPDVISAVMTQAQRRGQVSYKDIVLDSVTIQGVTKDYVSFTSFDAERGRMMSPIEVERDRPVAIIGFQTAQRLFGQADPLDKVIKIEGVHFRVVGVSSKKGSFLGNSLDENAVMPLGLFQKLYGSRPQLSIVVKPRDPSLVPAAMDEATVALRVDRRLKPKERDNFGIFTSETLLGLYRQATTGIFAVLLGVVALSLLVGGIVIMNIMLMVVSERTREIGLRKALGARRKDIMSQVLTESVTLSTFGGLVGIVLGFVLARTIATVTPLPARLELWSVALGIGITAAIGLFFGAFPASRAARLDPIEALRRE